MRPSAPAGPDDKAYQAWIREHDTPTPRDRKLIRARVPLLPRRPVVSVVVAAARGGSAASLGGTLASVRAQLYPDWQLCIGHGPTHAPGVPRLLDETARADPVRVALARSPAGGDACASANAALGAAAGDFVALLGHGDLLPAHALFEVAAALSEHPGADLVYTDEDRIGADGRRSAPRFKPMWSPELLVSHDAIGGLAVYRRALVERLGRLRPELAGAEHWDLALRATAATAPDRVRHVPAVLYHRREPNAPDDRGMPDRARAAGRRAVRDHLDAAGAGAARLEAAPLAPDRQRVLHPLPEPAPLVSVIVPTRDRAALLEKVCAGVLGGTDWTALELLLMDNGSVEPAALSLLARLEREDARVRVLRSPGPFNYPRLNNEAARAARGEVLVLLNNDVEVVDPGWLAALVRHALRPEVGVVGAKLLYPDGRVQHGGMVLGPAGAVQHVHRFADGDAPGYLGQLALTRALSAVTGACLALRRAVYEEAGGLDEALAVTFNDVDLCLRVADFGYRVVWTPDAVLVHDEGFTRGADSASAAQRARADAEWALMRRRWGRMMDKDPYHNPNVLLHAEPVAVPSPPRRAPAWLRPPPLAARAAPAPATTEGLAHPERRAAHARPDGDGAGGRQDGGVEPARGDSALPACGGVAATASAGPGGHGGLPASVEPGLFAAREIASGEDARRQAAASAHCSRAEAAMRARAAARAADARREASEARLRAERAEGEAAAVRRVAVELEARLHAKRAAFLAERDALRDEREALRGALRRAVAERDAVLRSTIWRATGPLRRIGRLVPGAVRGALKRLG